MRLAAKIEPGTRFDRLVAISEAEPIFDKKGVKISRTLCRCDCGNLKIIRNHNLRLGTTKSCGCARFGRIVSHGMAHERIYKEYWRMKARVSESNKSCKKYYFDREIHVCDEWLGDDGFITFKEWALSNGYTDDLSLERIDVNKGYSPENCTWIPAKDQCLNRTNSVRYTVDGETNNLSVLCRKYGVAIGTVRSRLKMGWGIEEAFKRKPNEIRHCQKRNAT